MTTSPPPRLALVGDRSASVEAHARIPGLIRALATGTYELIEVYWMHSTTIASPADVAGFDGVWVVPGSPYANTDGVLAAITFHRVHSGSRCSARAAASSICFSSLPVPCVG